MLEFIKHFFTEQWGGMLGGLLTTFVIFLIKIIFDHLRSSSSEYTGRWMDTIFDAETGEVVKVDIWNIKFNGNNKSVKGKITRIYGVGKNRKWKCSGSVLNHTFYLIYEGQKEYSKHNGCVVAAIKDYPVHFDLEGTGHYIKSEENVIKTVKINFYKLSKEDWKEIQEKTIDQYLIENKEIWK